MEEKERYGITDAHYLCDSAIFDTETTDILRLYQICDLLNHYFKRIKELQDLVIEYKNKLYRILNQVDNLIKKNQQLKQ